MYVASGGTTGTGVFVGVGVGVGVAEARGVGRGVGVSVGLARGVRVGTPAVGAAAGQRVTLPDGWLDLVDDPTPPAGADLLHSGG